MGVYGPFCVHFHQKINKNVFFCKICTKKSLKKPPEFGFFVSPTYYFSTICPGLILL